MKKNLTILPLLICLCFFSFNDCLFAQKIRFTDTSNRWQSSWWVSQGANNGVGDNYNFIYQDTIITIAGKNYQLLTADTTIKLLVREDTIAGKVFVKAIGNKIFYCDVTDTNEFVYYDYNLQVGDTLNMPLVYIVSMPPSNLQSKHVVQSIDSVAINGVWHKKLNMNVISGFTYSTSYNLIEGIGTNKAPIIIPSGPGYGATHLNCFINNGINPLTAYTNCNTTSLTPLFNRNDLVLYPNPTNNQLNIIYKGQATPNMTIRISDILGRSQLEKSFKNNTDIDLSDYKSGLYFVQFIYDNNVVLSQKFTVYH